MENPPGKAGIASIARSLANGVKAVVHKAVSGITHTVKEPDPCDLLKQLNLDYNGPTDDIEAYLTYRTNTTGVCTKPVSLRIVKRKGQRSTNRGSSTTVGFFKAQCALKKPTAVELQNEKRGDHKAEAIAQTGHGVCVPKAVLEMVSETNPKCVVQNECSDSIDSDRQTKTKTLKDTDTATSAARESQPLLVDVANTNFNNCQSDQTAIATISDTCTKHDTSLVHTDIAQGRNQTNAPLFTLNCNKSVITNTLENVKRNLQALIERAKPEDEISKSINVRLPKAGENAPSNNEFQGYTMSKNHSKEYFQKLVSDNIREFEHDITFLSHCSNMTSTPEKSATEHKESFNDTVYKKWSTCISQRKAAPRIHPSLVKSSTQVTPPPLNKNVQTVYPETRKHPEDQYSVKENISCSKSTDSSVQDLAELDASNFKIPFLAELNENLKDRHGQPICIKPVRRCLSFDMSTRDNRNTQKKPESAKTFRSETEEAVYYLIKKYLGEDEYAFD